LAYEPHTRAETAVVKYLNDMERFLVFIRFYCVF